MTPRLGIHLDYSAPFADAAAEIVEAERIGVDVVSASEAYSFDAVSRLGYLAGVTSRIGLAAGILPVFSRTPTLIAMTAAGLDDVSGGRFELGLGASGPQVIEGFHGVAYERPLGKIRETVEICRTVWKREPLAHEGREYRMPAEGGRGLGKPLKLVNHPRRDRIPISLASIAPKGVAQAAEIAEGWIPIFFWPERARDAWGEALDRGLARRDASLGALGIEAQAPLYVGEHADAALTAHRANLALYVGGMGAVGANFYTDLASSYGLGDEARRVQELYLSGRKDEAIVAVPEELVRGTALVGTEAEVRDRIRTYADAGVTTLTARPVGRTTAERLEQLEAARALLDAPTEAPLSGG